MNTTLVIPNCLDEPKDSFVDMTQSKQVLILLSCNIPCALLPHLGNWPFVRPFSKVWFIPLLWLGYDLLKSVLGLGCVKTPVRSPNLEAFRKTGHDEAKDSCAES